MAVEGPRPPSVQGDYTNQQPASDNPAVRSQRGLCLRRLCGVSCFPSWGFMFSLLEGWDWHSTRSPSLRRDRGTCSTCTRASVCMLAPLSTCMVAELCPHIFPMLCRVPGRITPPARWKDMANQLSSGRITPTSSLHPYSVGTPVFRRASHLWRCWSGTHTHRIVATGRGLPPDRSLTPVCMIAPSL